MSVSVGVRVRVRVNVSVAIGITVFYSNLFFAQDEGARRQERGVREVERDWS